MLSTAWVWRDSVWSTGPLPRNTALSTLTNSYTLTKAMCGTEDGDISVAEDHRGWDDVFALASHEKDGRTSEADTDEGLHLVTLCVVDMPA